MVKLPKDRVEEIVASGGGQAFASAGRVFREWLVFPTYDRERWDAAIREACAAAS